MSNIAVIANELIEQDAALTEYLDALLNEPNQIDDLMGMVDIDQNIPVEVGEESANVEFNPDPIVEEKPNGSTNTEVTNTNENTLIAPPVDTQDLLWNNSNIQALSFVVADVLLCVPLKKLNGIVAWDGNTTSIPGQANWCLGLLRNRNRNIIVVDMGKVLQRETQNPEFNESQRRSANKYILLTDEGKWGLACDSVENIYQLTKEKIDWHPTSEKRLIMGTVSESMTLLLNLDELAYRLNNSLI